MTDGSWGIWFAPDYDEDQIDHGRRECPNCGGEGVVASCFEEWACVDPEKGCDLCRRRCDWWPPSAGRSVLEEGEP